MSIGKENAGRLIVSIRAGSEVPKETKKATINLNVKRTKTQNVKVIINLVIVFFVKLLLTHGELEIQTSYWSEYRIRRQPIAC